MYNIIVIGEWFDNKKLMTRKQKRVFISPFEIVTVLELQWYIW